MRIFDSHTHAWNCWPYDDYPAKPSSGESLLADMAENSVGRALIVCADIDSSSENNRYVADLARRYALHLDYVIDVDCAWSRDHHKPGAVSRLRRLVEEFPDAVGVTHYVKLPVDGWFTSPEGSAWLDLVASEYGVLSLSAGPEWAGVVHQIAREHEDLTILWHHLAGMHVAKRHLLSDVATTADAPNVLLKLSGFHYLSAESTVAPWSDVPPVLDELYSCFGADRMCWGSDSPASLRYADYRTCFGAIRAWMDRLGEGERSAIMGGNLERVLEVRSSAARVA
jgi:L-fuconolactonase